MAAVRRQSINTDVDDFLLGFSLFKQTQQSMMMLMRSFASVSPLLLYSFFISILASFIFFSSSMLMSTFLALHELSSRLQSCHLPKVARFAVSPKHTATTSVYT